MKILQRTNIYRLLTKLVNKKEAEADPKEPKTKRSFLEMIFLMSPISLFCFPICSQISRLNKSIHDLANFGIKFNLSLIWSKNNNFKEKEEEEGQRELEINLR